MRLRSPLLLLLATLTASCGNKEGDAKPAASASASAPAPAAASASAAAAVDPKVDALARAVLACKATDTGFESGCGQLKDWREARDDFANGKADASLVAMLADPSEKIRFLAASKLNQYGKAYLTDKDLAAAVLTAAEKEKTRFAGHDLGNAVGRIKVRETGTFDRVKAMVKAHELPSVRRGILWNLLRENDDFEPAFDLTREMAKASENDISTAALSAVGAARLQRPDDTCQVFFENFEHPNDEAAVQALQSLAFQPTGNCPSRYDTLLDALEKRMKKNPPVFQGMSLVQAATHLCTRDRASPKQKKRAGDLARTAAGTKDLAYYVRVEALRAVLSCDRAGGKAFVAGFKKDPNKDLAEKAAKLIAEK